MLIHASSHLACDFPRIITATDVDYKRYLVHYFGVARPTYFDLVKGSVGITGFIMVIFMLIAYTLASRRLRRNLTKLPKPFDKLTGFNAFWYSHHLLLAVYVLLIIHGVSLFLEQRWYHKTVHSVTNYLIWPLHLSFIINRQWICIITDAASCRYGCILLVRFYSMVVKGCWDFFVPGFTLLKSAR